MVGFIIATHGQLASGFENSIELIMGNQEKIRTLSINHDTNIDEFGTEISNAIVELDSGTGVIIFTDILLASPFNKAVSHYPTMGDKHDFRVISGVNLPMLIEALSCRLNNMSLDEIVESSLVAGESGITEFFSHMESAKNK